MNKITIIGKKCCSPCDTCCFIIDKLLKQKAFSNFTLNKVYLNTTNKEDILQKLSELTMHELSEFDIPIVICNDKLISKQSTNEKLIKDEITKFL